MVEGERLGGNLKPDRQGNSAGRGGKSAPVEARKGGGERLRERQRVGSVNVGEG